MLGAAVIVVVLVVVIPVAVLMSGGLVAALLGWAVGSNAEADHAESPYVELNR